MFCSQTLKFFTSHTSLATLTGLINSLNNQPIPVKFIWNEKRNLGYELAMRDKPVRSAHRANGFTVNHNVNVVLTRFKVSNISLEIKLLVVSVDTRSQYRTPVCS